MMKPWFVNGRGNNWPFMLLSFHLQNSFAAQKIFCLINDSPLSCIWFIFILKSWTIYQQLWSFLVLCKILCHYKSLAPSKSMPQKRNHDFTERYPNIKVGTYKPMRIKDILIKTGFSAVRQRFRIWVRHIIT